MAECNLATLLSDACTNGFSGAAENETMFRALLLQLACNISELGPGGGSTLTCGNYAGAEPNFTPSGSCWIAIDTSNDALWVYRSGAWVEYIAGL